ncbi:MAG: NEW3 domain-containing protein [Candidatus Promineifilaceae bacterium]
MKRFFLTTLSVFVVLFFAGHNGTAHAQSGDPVLPPLAIHTEYPSEVVGIGENVTINLKLETGTAAQVVQLAVEDLPDSWTADFKGGSHMVHSVYVQPDTPSSVDLKVSMPTAVEAGTYDFLVRATGSHTESSLPLEITVEQKLPPSLSLTADLPVLRGKPDGTFRYNATLKNEGDDDLNVDLTAETPSGFSVTFTSGGQDVTTLPLEGNSTKTLTIEAAPLFKVAAADYPIAVHAQAGEAATELDLMAEVVGQADLELTTPDGRLSGELPSGKETAVSLVLRNTGSAAAEAVSMSATVPTGWTVTFDPAEVAELAPNSQADVVAHIQPADNAISGDYALTLKAQPKDNAIQSVDYRATVQTSTLWGIGGVVLIAVAVAVVGLAVTRFGRR